VWTRCPGAALGGREWRATVSGLREFIPWVPSWAHGVMGASERRALYPILVQCEPYVILTVSSETASNELIPRRALAAARYAPTPRAHARCIIITPRARSSAGRSRHAPRRWVARAATPASVGIGAKRCVSWIVGKPRTPSSIIVMFFGRESPRPGRGERPRVPKAPLQLRKREPLDEAVVAGRIDFGERGVLGAAARRALWRFGGSAIIQQPARP